MIQYYNYFNEKLIRIRNQIIKININLNIKLSKKSNFNEIIYFFIELLKKTRVYLIRHY